MSALRRPRIGTRAHASSASASSSSSSSSTGVCHRCRVSLSPPFASALHSRITRAGGRRCDVVAYRPATLELGTNSVHGTTRMPLVIFAAPLLATAMAAGNDILAMSTLTPPPSPTDPSASRYCVTLSKLAERGYVVVALDVWPAAIAPPPLWRVPALYEATRALVACARAGALQDASSGEPLPFHRECDIFVAGHSLGGAAAVCCGRTTAGVSAVVALHPTRCDPFCPTRPRHVPCPMLYVTGGSDWLVRAEVSRSMMTADDVEVHLVHAGHADMLGVTASADGAHVDQAAGDAIVTARAKGSSRSQASPSPELYAALVDEYVRAYQS